MSTPQNMTNQMKESLENLRSSLLCPLCNHLMVDCSMLHCGHSFCHGCIITYTSDNWYCPVVGCSMPVSAGRARGTSYVKKNSQIESVISALLTIEQNISNAPERWWIKSDDDRKNSVVQFHEETGGDEEEFVDFQQLCEQQKEAAGCKRKDRDDPKEDDDESSTTKEIEEATKPEADVDRINISDISLLEQGNQPVDRQRVSCSVPDLFSQQFSPISMKNSQQSGPPSGLSAGRKTATFSQTETVNRNFENVCGIPASEEQKTATSSEIQNAFLPAKSSSPHSAPKKSFIEKQIETPKEGTITTDATTRRSSPRVSFQPRPKVMLLYPSWTLKAADARCIRKCLSDGNITMLSKYPTCDNLDLSFDFETETGRQSFMTMLSSQRDENRLSGPLSCYAVSTAKDYSMDEGIVVPRSFQYYLAVASGIPIVDIGFLSTFTSKKKRSPGHQQYPFPYSPTSGTESNEGADRKFQVIGASDYAWNAPQKALAAALERYQSWLKAEGDSQSDTLQPGTDLLSGYCVILLGEYDQATSNQRTAKRKKQKQEINEIKKTRGSLSILLQLCGASVYDVNVISTMKQLKSGLTANQCDCVNETLPSQADTQTLKEVLDECNANSGGNNQNVTLVAMVKDNSCMKFAEEFLSQYSTAAALPSNITEQISIVTCDWLFDCIGEFEAKKID